MSIINANAQQSSAPGDPIANVRSLIEAPFTHSVDLLWLLALIVVFGAALGVWGMVMSHVHLAME